MWRDLYRFVLYWNKYQLRSKRANSLFLLKYSQGEHWAKV